MSASPSLGVAVVGTGRAAQRHLHAIGMVPGLRLEAIHSRRPAEAGRLAEPLGARGVDSFEALLADPAITIIALADEPQRRGLAIAAARAGKHLLLEKPLAASVAEGRAIAAACRDAGVVASVVSQRRFDQAVDAARTLLAEGAIGRPVFAFVELYLRAGADEAAWRRHAVGGVTFNRLIHHIDLLQALLGPARRVCAMMDAAVPETRASLLVGFDGLEATLVANAAMGQSFGERVRLVGEHGSLTVAGHRVQLSPSPFGPGPERSRKRLLLQALGPAGQTPALAAGTLDMQWRDVAECVRTGAPPRVGIEDGLSALEVAAAAHVSWRSGRTADPRDAFTEIV